MPIFLDTGKIPEIEMFMKMGVIRGVTTNPSILLKDGVKGGIEGVRKRAQAIADIIRPYPISIEVTTNDKDEMIEQAVEFSQWAENIVVKITIHGPEGELTNLEAVHELEERLNIRINVTAMMNAQQCFLSALSGASYVSLFGGRVNNMGYNACGEITRLRKLIDGFGLKSKMIIGSTREVLNVVEWLEAGAHIVTVVPEILKGMIVHPYSKETIKMFLDDAKKADKELLRV
jgi:transaldolase